MKKVLAVIIGLVFAFTGLWPQALNTVEAPYIIADTAFQGPGSGITGFAPGLTTGDTTAVLADLASTASGQGDALVATLGPLSNEVASTQHAINQELPSVFRWFAAAQQADVLGNTALLDVGPAIVAAYAASQQLLFPPGTYRASILPNFNIAGTWIVGEGLVQINYTGTGQGLVADAGSGSQKVYNVHIENLIINGTAAATDGMFTRAVHHSSFKRIRLRNFPTSGLRVNFAVCNHYENIVVSSYEVGATVPTNIGIILDQRGAGETTADCVFTNLISEGNSGGLQLTAATMNKFIGGTVEGNSAWGITETAASSGNTFIGMDTESNGANFTPFAITGSISGTSLTVTATAGVIPSNSTRTVAGPGIPGNVIITAQTSGTAGSTGVYTISSNLGTLVSAPLTVTGFTPSSYDYSISGSQTNLIGCLSSNQALGIVVQSGAEGTNINGGNGFYILAQAGSLATTIQGWSYQSNYGIQDLAASGQTVRNNNFNVALGTTDLTGGTWTPTPTNLTVVGTPTYTGRYWIAGGCLFYNIRVQSTTSTAATAATTVFSFPPGHSPTEALGLGQCSASNPVGGVGYGNGVNYPGGGGIFVPAWSANADVHVSGWWPLQ